MTEWRPSAPGLSARASCSFAGLRDRAEQGIPSDDAPASERAPKVVQERLGHASIGITLDTCSHVMPGMQEAAEKIDAGLRAALGQ